MGPAPGDERLSGGRPRVARVGVFDRASGHEQVVFCQDTASGLRAIVAIYSTALGPALGGTRFYPYESEADALDDVLNLSKAMAYKNALAGLDHGGGKAVIIGDPATAKSEVLLRAYGRFVEGPGWPLHHGLRRRNLRRGHGRRGPGVLPRHGAQLGQRRRRRLQRAHRVRRVPGDARRGALQVGRRRPRRPTHRHRRRRQGRAAPRRARRRREGRSRGHRHQPGRDRVGARPPSRHRRGRRQRRPAPRRARRLRAVCARWRPRRRGRRGAAGGDRVRRGQQPARPRPGRQPPARARHRLLPRLPRQRRRA